MMRPVLTAVFLCAVAALAGCPIYDHEDNGCYSNSDCALGYSCEHDTGNCVLSSGNNHCSQPADCGVNETCSRAAQCVSGDCSFSGCVSGYSCDSSSGTWMCVANGSLSNGGSSNEGGAAGAANLAGAGGMSGSAGEAPAVAGQAGSN